jgi:hypothetical protein
VGRLKGKSAKAIGDRRSQDIAEGTKKLEEQSKAVAKLAAEWVKLRDTGESQAHRAPEAHDRDFDRDDDPLGSSRRSRLSTYGQIRAEASGGV